MASLRNGDTIDESMLAPHHWYLRESDGRADFAGILHDNKTLLGVETDDCEAILYRGCRAGHQERPRTARLRKSALFPSGGLLVVITRISLAIKRNDDRRRRLKRISHIFGNKASSGTSLRDYWYQAVPAKYHAIWCYFLQSWSCFQIS